MKLLLIFLLYLSVGVGVNLLFMWFDAKHPDLEIGEMPDGGTFIICTIVWPFVLIAYGYFALSSGLDKSLKMITKRMKEDAKR